MAMGLEKSGEAFYRAVAAKCTSQSMRDLFVDLADQEVLHHATFSKLSRTIGDYPLMLDEEWDQYMAYLETTVRSALFQGPDKALAAADDVQDEREAVAMAMGFEKETMLFFHDLRDKVPDKDTEVITKIIDEEKLHLRRLASMLPA